MMPEATHIDLDALASGFIGEVKLFGAMRQVRQLDGGHYKKAQHATQTGDVIACYEIAAWLLPDLTAEQIDQLNPHQVSALLARALGGVAAVEALYPNVIRPTGETCPPASPHDSPSTT